MSRGSPGNPQNRFEKLSHTPDPEELQENPRTQILDDHSASIITRNDSPDVGFSASINPYRGCEHGCAYCFARPTHEYLGFSAGLDFETKIIAKRNAADLLRRELSSPSWAPRVLGFSGVTDPFQPIERKLEISRRCLEVLAEARNPIVIITKNYLVTRDRDLLQELARHQAVRVMISLTSLDAELAGKMEPRASRPAMRLRAIEELTTAGIPVGVLTAPIVPGLTDHEIPELLKAARDAGASNAGYVFLRLPYAVKEIFATWVTSHFPDRSERILNLVRGAREGKLNHSEFGERMRGSGAHAEMISKLFKNHLRRLGLDRPAQPLSTQAFRRPGREGQLLLDL